jgi:hypothetical protein
MAAPTSRRPPRWLKYANRINVALLGRGIGPASQRLLSVPGRNNGDRGGFERERTHRAADPTSFPRETPAV